MRGFIWVVLALLLFLAWVGSYIVYHVAGLSVRVPQHVSTSEKRPRTPLSLSEGSILRK